MLCSTLLFCRRHDNHHLYETDEQNQHVKTAKAIICGLGVCTISPSHLIWGLSPVYWKVLQSVPALEIICHRIIWSFALIIPVTLFGGHRKELWQVLRRPRILLILLTTSFLMGGNWLIYIWAVNNGRVLQASLGYFICPLVSIFLGIVFLRERVRFLQGVAIVLASVAVLYLTFQYGEFPTISLFLAFSFGTYGLIRKVAPVSAITGLTVETLILTIPALTYLIYLATIGLGIFGHKGTTIDLFLMGTALVTAIPLLLFTLGARRLPLSTMGFLQYVAPTCIFLLGIFFYHEPLTRQQAVTFMFIWTALAIYSVDSFLFYRKSHQVKRRSEYN